MSWFADLAGKAENLLNNLDEQTGAALRNHNVGKPKKSDRRDVIFSDSTWNQKKRSAPRKKSTVTETKSNSMPTSKPTMYHQTRSQTKDIHENGKDHSPMSKKTQLKKSTQYNLNNCPKTLVGDVKDNEVVLDQFGLKHRRYSLPGDLEILSNEHLTYKMQNLEVENAMLKNELNVMNREVSELLDRLRKTEDELSCTYTKLEKCDALNQKITLEKEALSSQVDLLKQKVSDLTTTEMTKYKDRNQGLETEIELLRERNAALEEKIREFSHNVNEKDTIHIKLEAELRHAQSIINELQRDLEKSNDECHRIEKDWETYKLRVKSMLYAKDNEIKALQEGINLTEDTKVLVGEIENLKIEREELSEALSKVRTESEGMKHNIEHLESRYNTAERVVTALRDALKEERSARNRTEAQCNAIGKDLKALQVETGQTIASLRTALRDRENDLNHLRETTSSVQTADTSALNVADYDVSTQSIDNEKIEYLTQTLVQRQRKIDSLLAENNMLKIQNEKLESKYKSEITARSNYSHSVVHLQDGGRSRTHATDSTLSTFSRRIGVFIKRNPLFRIFVMLYMIGLHFWVLTVLFNSTPEDYFKRPSKS